MVQEPVRPVRVAGPALLEAGATLVAGHSAHVFHGVAGRILYDLGDFIDDYRVDPVLRNDLGLLWLVDLEAGRPARLELLPLKLDYCHTSPATGEDAAWIRRRFRAACAALGTEVAEEGGRLVIWLDYSELSRARRAAGSGPYLPPAAVAPRRPAAGALRSARAAAGAVSEDEWTAWAPSAREQV
jgi:hypothetical protein